MIYSESRLKIIDNICEKTLQEMGNYDVFWTLYMKDIQLLLFIYLGRFFSHIWSIYLPFILKGKRMGAQKINKQLVLIIV